MEKRTKHLKLIHFVIPLFYLFLNGCSNLSLNSETKTHITSTKRSPTVKEMIQSICYDKIYPVEKTDLIIQMQIFCGGYIQDGITLKLRNKRLQIWKYRFNTNWSLSEVEKNPILDSLYEIPQKNEELAVSKIQNLMIDTLLKSPEIETVLCDDNFVENLKNPRDYMLKLLKWSNKEPTRFCGCFARIELYQNFKYRIIWHDERPSKLQCLAKKISNEIYNLLESDYGMNL